ncbi:TfuA-like protein [Lysinibacillus sp. NPDC093688]|uniref:TfuA-like protein n=1 Tax=Lysinibacillus sp. NPDC093688 TaxID=3390577 RepID=UPI003D033832
MNEVQKHLDLQRDLYIYTGPSLSRDITRELAPNATILPPAKRGDLALDSFEMLPKVIVLIDGELFQNLTVSPREIMKLLENGVTVIGAASIGAIRAVELRNLGMIGVGCVYEMYLSNEVIADDEVVMAMDPITSEPYSEPAVNFRFLIKEAINRGVFTQEMYERTIDELKKVYFSKRNLQILLAIVRELYGHDVSNQIEQLAHNFDYQIKSMDAKKAIEKGLNLFNQCSLKEVN